MAKGRMINRTIATDKKFNNLSVDAQWLYMRMLPFMDDHGRITGDLFELKYQVIPSTEHTTEWIHGQLLSMKQKGLIFFELDKTIQFKGFDKNQKIGHRKAKSVYTDISELNLKDKKSSRKVAKGSNNIIKKNIIKDNKKYKEKPRDLEMVISYFKSKNIPDANTNAKKFYDHYEATGWFRGKTKIKNWKMCLSSWDFKNTSTNQPIQFSRLKSGIGYKAYCSKCGKMEMPKDRFQIKKGSSCHAVEYVPIKPNIKKESKNNKKYNDLDIKNVSIDDLRTLTNNIGR